MNVELTEEQKIQILNSSDVYTVMRYILMRENKIGRDHEHIWCVCLNPSNKIINIELVSLGAIDETVLKPMQVFRIALIKGAVRLILVHNHPQGELKPSECDLDITDRMIQVGNIVNVEVLDHLIITEQYYYSFKGDGLMAKLRISKKWVPSFMEINRIKFEAMELGEQIGRKEGRKEGKKIGMEKGLEKGMNKRNKEIAKAMKKKGTEIEFIAEITGLSKDEIKKL